MASRANLPMFTLSRERGFLPREDPLTKLPDAFAPLESLLNRMTIRQPDGSKGLLALGQFGDAAKEELRDLAMKVKVEQAIASGNQNLISALFRDYCFLTSAYLLEPVDQSFRATGAYNQGRDVLPQSIAVPLKALADALGHFPYMEYASSYALQNYRRVIKGDRPADRLGPLKEWETDNLRIIRAFEDHDGSESGFILVHVSMVAHTGKLVDSVEGVLDAATAQSQEGFTKAMTSLYETYKEINKTMDTMWGWSRPIDYLKFRSFIFGTGPTKMNTLFPKGVIYEGVSDEPQAFRGESGANDSIIPLADNLLEITAKLPKNEFTATLRDFRTYRPSAQRNYLELLESRATQAKVAEFAQGNEENLAMYILMIDQVREFRDRHWRFTKEYIIKRSDHPIATGGSPILQYLPHNLAVVLQVLETSCDMLPSTSRLPDDLAEKVEACRARAKVQRKVLEREVKQLKGEVRGLDDKRVLVRGAIGCDGVG